jgi:hypothetical protein
LSAGNDLSANGNLSLISVPQHRGAVHFEEALAGMVGDKDRAAGLLFVSLAIALVTPYFLRRRAMKRKERERKRARPALG